MDDCLKPIDVKLYEEIKKYAMEFFYDEEFLFANDYFFNSLASFVMGWLEYSREKGMLSVKSDWSLENDGEEVDYKA